MKRDYKELFEKNSIEQRRHDNPFLEKIVSEFKRGIEGSRQKRDEETFNELTMIDRQFHEAIVEYAGNPFLSRTYHTISKHLKQLSYQASYTLFTEDESRLRLLGYQHLAILNAIKMGFAGEAHDLMNEHLDYSMNAVLKFME